MNASFSINVPRIPVGQWFEDFFDWLTTHMAGFFDTISTVIAAAVNGLVDVLEAPDPVLLAIAFALLGLVLVGWKFGLGSLLGLLFIVSVEQWVAAMETLALVLVSGFAALVIAIPLGILAAGNRWVSTVTKPIMDLMQTMPAFVYLVPVVTLFGIGVVPGVVATIIFALPPGVRLTELGIRNVDAEIVEASHAFGAKPRQSLLGVELPLALPTIMAGVNQVLMMCLAMAVVAGLVGGGGLGGEVTSAIATLNIGLGFESGLAVVVLAIYLDRLTASLGQVNRGSRLRFRRRNRQSAMDQDAFGDTSEEVVAPTERAEFKVGA